MTPEHLLPANASPLEQSHSLATASLSRQTMPADAIRQFKVAPTDPLLPWLIWEYGLGELLPYLPEPRRAIAEGIRWQRLRGTPAALTTALSWIGATATVEQETPGIHFAEFQFDPGLVLDSDTAIANLIAIARLSAPARSRLSRIYHGYDLRRLVLDESRLGEALLSDHSGVFWTDGQTKLSFGRVRKFAQPAQDIALIPAREAIRFATARLLDRYLLDFSSLGDAGHTPNEEIIHAHLFTLANALGLADPFGFQPERRFCRAMVVLSDSMPLGDINANLPRFIWQEVGQGLVLGSGDGLSATPHRLIRVEVLERGTAEHPGSTIVPTLSLHNQRESQSTHRVSARADASLGLVRLGDERPVRDVLSLTRLYSLMQAPLPDPAGWLPRLFQKAQLVLSDSTVLGEVNARTPRCAVFRRFTLPRLGELALGDLAEIAWQPLTEMQIRTSVLAVPEPYVLADPLAHQQRLRCHRILPGTPLGALHLGDPGQSALIASRRDASRSNDAVWTGQSWTGVRWPTSPWNDTREVIGTHHLTQ